MGEKIDFSNLKGGNVNLPNLEWTIASEEFILK